MFNEKIKDLINLINNDSECRGLIILDNINLKEVFIHQSDNNYDIDSALWSSITYICSKSMKNYFDIKINANSLNLNNCINLREPESFFIVHEKQKLYASLIEESETEGCQ